MKPSCKPYRRFRLLCVLERGDAQLGRVFVCWEGGGRAVALCTGGDVASVCRSFGDNETSGTLLPMPL
jgi:hypothetical protein